MANTHLGFTIKRECDDDDDDDGAIDHNCDYINYNLIL